MREIKFRAWNENQKRFLPMALYGLVGNKEDLLNSEILQFTGLKDKNGKEIFEGDIIIVSNGQKGIVYFEEGRWNIKGKFIAELTPLFQFQNPKIRCKVIGNKFENPELLK